MTQRTVNQKNLILPKKPTYNPGVDPKVFKWITRANDCFHALFNHEKDTILGINASFPHYTSEQEKKLKMIISRIGKG
jgi:hypothetical protein